MKKGLKFDKAKAKKFLVLNVEKFVFGLSIVIVAGLIYAGLTSESYNKTPADVETLVKRARDNINLLDVLNPEVYDIKPPNFSERAQRAGDQVPGESFPALVLGKHPTIRSGEKRKEPEFLPPLELVVSSGVGPFAFINLNAPQTPQQSTLPGASTLPGQQPRQQRQPPKKPKGKQSLKELFSQPPQGAAGAAMGEPGMMPGMMPGMEAGMMPGMEAGMMPGDPGMAAGMMPGGDPMMAGMGGEGMMGSQGVTAPPNSEVKGVQWVCLTALVPHRDQVDEFYETFENAGYTDQARDYPDYLMYLVQRADVTDDQGADPETLKWESLQVYTELQRTRRWAVTAPEIVNPAMTDADLLFPLGPLLGRGWGKEVAHPKIPIVESTMMSGDMGMGMPMAGDPAAGGAGTGLSPDIVNFEEAKAGSDLDFLKNLPKSPATGRGGMGAEAGMPGGMPGGGGMSGNSGLGVSSMIGGLQRGAGMMPGMDAGMMPGMDPGMMPGMGMPGEMGMEGGMMMGQKEPEYKLMRFFDFNVEKGKLYRYRVQLVVANPNKDLPGQFLADASLAKKAYCLSPWSEPSPVAEVTSYGYVLAGPVTPARGGKEPEARAIVVQFDEELGVKATDECRNPEPKEKKVMGPLSRGQLIHYTANIDVVHPLTHQAAQTEMEFTLDMVLLDLKGGEDYAPDDRRNRDKLPGELLFLTPNGRLVTQSELEDEREFNAEVAMLQALKKAREGKSAYPMDGAMPGEFMPGMPGLPGMMP